MTPKYSCVAVLLAATLNGATVFAQATSVPNPAPTPVQTTTAPSTAAPDVTSDVPSYIKPETPEQRRARIGTGEDPGLNPDPKQKWYRFGQWWTIEPFERKWAAYDQPDGFVRPFKYTPFVYEIYQQNEKTVWCWMPVINLEGPAADETAPRGERYDDATYEFMKRVRPQYSKLEPAKAATTIQFLQSSAGLPTNGSWRNAPAVADMNGDGCLDIAAPPPRKGNGSPVIFLGDCKGSWTVWADAKFSQSLDYGGVAAADFNKDGKMDLAFAVHLVGLYVFIGDGKGKFTAVNEGLPRDFPTRRVMAVDVDRDTYPDLVAASEGPTSGESNMAYAGLRVYLNRRKGQSWEGRNILSTESKVGGDWLSSGNFNGDNYPDFVLSSVYFGSTDVLATSSAKNVWKPVPTDGDILPSLSYYFGNTTGKFTSKTRDDVILSYTRYWPQDLNTSRVGPPPLHTVSNVDRISFSGGRVQRQALARYDGGFIYAIGNGDFDGDGNLDVIYIRDTPREAVILLGDGRGAFKSAGIRGLELQSNRLYDLRVADVNRDGRPDVVVMYEADAKSLFADQNGSIRVFLNGGTSAVDGATPASR